MTFGRYLKATLLASGALLSAGHVAHAAAASGFTVPAQNLTAALMQLAKVSGRDILFSPQELKGAVSTPVRGAANFDEAIRQMLANTGMAETVSGATVIVHRQASRPNLVRTSLTTALAVAPPAAHEPAQVEEVTVTARKARERLQDVPIAVTALTGLQLAGNDHRRIEDLSALTPSTNFVVTNGHQASFSIRGLGANPANDGLEGSVGIFLDGVYLSRPGMAATDLIDINQIEVLRGPQGTLFGKNTTAGAVSITTQSPSFDFGGKLQATYGNYNFQQYQGEITGPIIGDTLAGRLSAYSTTRDGDVYDPSTRQKVGDIDRKGVRGQLLFQPTSDFSLRLIGEYEREQQSNGALLILNSFGATPATLQARFAALGAAVIPDPSGATTYMGAQNQTGTRQTAFSAEANWNVQGFTVTSLSAYRQWSYVSNADDDATGADAIAGGYNNHDKQWSEELRVKFPPLGPVSLVTGLYYFRQAMNYDAITNYGPEATAFLSAIPDAQLPAAAAKSASVAALVNDNNSQWNTYATPTINSYAAFGQAVWHVNSQWNVTGGFRETYETESETVHRPNPVSSITGAPVASLASAVYAPFSVAVNDASPSFLISTDYHLTPQLMVFASLSQGAKAGGVNTTLPSAGLTTASLKVRPETATDYEFGIKSELFDRRLRLSLDAFYTDVRDYQASFLSTVNNQTVSLLTNAGKVRSRGVEAEFTAVPAQGLTLSATGSYNDATYASYASAPCPSGTVGAISCNLTGRPVSGAPKWIANVQGRYEHRLGDGLVAFGSAEYSYKSHFYGYLDDSPLSRTGGYGLLNLRVGIHTADGRTELSLWGKNVTDVRYAATYLSYGSLLPGAYVPFFGDFATYGVTLSQAF